MRVMRFSGHWLLIAAAAMLCAVCSHSSARQADSMVAVDTDTTSTEVAVRKGLCMKLEKGGTIIIELYPDKAPMTVERIMKLAGDGFYDGLKFHRVESFLVQTGKADHDLPPLEGEMYGQRKIWHEEGMVGMARLPNGYDTATTQFYIMKERRPKLNGEYTLFGRVVSGMEHVHGLKKGHKIKSLVICDIE
jgi:cyclophilin family peptidyl-prolyl cis-trans isomerase